MKKSNIEVLTEDQFTNQDCSSNFFVYQQSNFTYLKYV